MRYTRLGRTDLQVSRFGFGGLQIATRMGYPEAERLLNTALDQGVNILDTARAYHDSEDRIGRALSARREEFVLATKAGSATRDGFWQDLEESLRQLRTDYIDIYQFHGADLSSGEHILRNETTIECMRQAQQQGKIRFIGFSAHSLEAALEYARCGAFDVLQYPISYVGSEAADRGLVAEAKRVDIGFLGMKPFGGGRLGQARHCLGYVFQFPSVVPLIGFESEQELREVMQLAETEVPLGETDRAEMARIKEDLGDRFCRGCNYCQPCPEGISIWSVMFLDVFVKQYGQEWLGQEEYREQMQAVRRCTECRQCVERCPFNLDVPVAIRGMFERYQQMVGSGTGDR